MATGTGGPKVSELERRMEAAAANGGYFNRPLWDKVQAQGREQRAIADRAKRRGLDPAALAELSRLCGLPNRTIDDLARVVTVAPLSYLYRLDAAIADSIDGGGGHEAQQLRVDLDRAVRAALPEGSKMLLVEVENELRAIASGAPDALARAVRALTVWG